MRNGLLVFFLAVLLVVSVTGLVLFYSEGGFGAGRGYGSQAPRSFWLLVFVAPLAIALVVVGYRIAFPEIKTEKPEQVEGEVAEDAERVERARSLDAIMHVLNEDERKVVEVVASAGGETMLQKDIRWKTGLSRVKVHRVLARLAQRGIVRVEKYYNTNKIALADWLIEAGNDGAQAKQTGE
jgi:uncharacterized membrane protein